MQIIMTFQFVMRIVSQCRKKADREYSDEIFLIRKYKCLEAVRIDFYSLSKPLPFQSRALITEMVHSSLFLLLFMKAFEKFVAFQLGGVGGWETNLKLYSLSENTFPLFLCQKRDFFMSNSGFQLEAVVEEIQGMDRSEHFLSQAPVLEYHSQRIFWQRKQQECGRIVLHYFEN